MQRLLSTLMAKQLTPAIVFAFSRKECEGAAMTARDLEPLEPEQVEAVRARVSSPQPYPYP